MSITCNNSNQLNSIQLNSIIFHSIQYNAVMHSTVQYSAVQRQSGLLIDKCDISGAAGSGCDKE